MQLSSFVSTLAVFLFPYLHIMYNMTFNNFHHIYYKLDILID